MSPGTPPTNWDVPQATRRFTSRTWVVPTPLSGGDTTLCQPSHPQHHGIRIWGALWRWDATRPKGFGKDKVLTLNSSRKCGRAAIAWMPEIHGLTACGLHAGQRGDYEWMWTVTDCNGCVDRDTLNITVVEPTPPFFPNSRSAWMRQSDRSPRKARRVGSGAASRQLHLRPCGGRRRRATSGWSGLERAPAP